MFNHKEVWVSSDPTILGESIVVEGQLTSLLKIDAFGRVMNFRQYGNRNHIHGWEVDHIVPVSAGGTDSPINLQPLNWLSNSQKADKSMNEALSDHRKQKMLAEALQRFTAR